MIKENEDSIEIPIIIKEIIPTAKTIQETYGEDIGTIKLICDEFNCDSNEYLLNPIEFEQLNHYYYS